MLCPQKETPTSMLKTKSKGTVKSSTWTTETGKRTSLETLNLVSLHAMNIFLQFGKKIITIIWLNIIYNTSQKILCNTWRNLTSSSLILPMKIWPSLLIDMLTDSKDVYSQHKFDIGKTRQKFYVKLKLNVALKRQRSSKVPLRLKEKLERPLTQLKDADIVRESGDDNELGSLFVNPIILMPKNDNVKLVIDTQFLNSLTDLTNYPCPLEPVKLIMTRLNGNFFSVSDLSKAIEPRNPGVD